MMCEPCITLGATHRTYSLIGSRIFRQLKFSDHLRSTKRNNFTKALVIANIKNPSDQSEPPSLVCESECPYSPIHSYGIIISITVLLDAFTTSIVRPSCHGVSKNFMRSLLISFASLSWRIQLIAAQISSAGSTCATIYWAHNAVFRQFLCVISLVILYVYSYQINSLLNLFGTLIYIP